jgi:hypothetical protein
VRLSAAIFAVGTCVSLIEALDKADVIVEERHRRARLSLGVQREIGA